MPQGTHDLDDLVRLSTDEAVLTGSLHISAVDDPSVVTRETLRAVLTGAGVREQYIDADALGGLVDAVHTDPALEHAAEVARGVAPVQGSDTSYTLTEKISACAEQIAEHERRLASDATAPGAKGEGDIDHYERSAYIIVHADETIGTVRPGDQQEDGVDIYGQTIASRGGAGPESLVDETVEIRDDGTIAATIPGRLRLDTGPLRIEETLVVNGDVDFTTGRIDFPGPVRIRGAVRDHFHVKAAGDIEIGELVQEACIETGAALTLKAGMAGKDSGSIRVVGALSAGYLERVRGEVTGEATVQRELTGCDLWIRGELDAQRASIRGGTVRLSKGGVVGTIGSVQGVETTIELGSVPRVEQTLGRVSEFGERIERRIECETERLETLKRTVAKPNAEQVEEQMSIQYTIDELRDRERRLDKADGALNKLMGEIAGTTLTVRRAIHAKVTIATPRFIVTFENDIEGESVIDTDESGSPTITNRGTARPLSEVARVVGRTQDREPSGLRAA